MKAYLTDVLNKLEAWSNCPTGPYERKEYEVGDYSFLGVGVMVSETRDYIIPMTFHQLIGIILHEGKNNLGINGPHEPGLIFMVNKIIKKEDDIIQSKGIKVIKSEVVSTNGPVFTIGYDEQIGTHYWEVVDGPEPSSTNLEHILSVMAYNDNFFDVFIESIDSFFMNVLNDEKEVEILIDKLHAIRDNVETFNKREIH